MTEDPDSKAELTNDGEANYRQFIQDALQMGCIWGLEGPEGWAVTGSETYERSQVMPFWSQPELAQPHCSDAWSEYQVVAISTEEFLDDWLPGMHEDEFLVGINWATDLSGVEIEPLDLLEDFESAFE